MVVVVVLMVAAAAAAAAVVVAVVVVIVVVAWIFTPSQSVPLNQGENTTPLTVHLLLVECMYLVRDFSHHENLRLLWIRHSSK